MPPVRDRLPDVTSVYGIVMIATTTQDTYILQANCLLDVERLTRPQPTQASSVSTPNRAWLKPTRLLTLACRHSPSRQLRQYKPIGHHNQPCSDLVCLR